MPVLGVIVDVDDETGIAEGTEAKSTVETDKPEVLEVNLCGGLGGAS